MEQDTSFTLLKEQFLTMQKVTVDLPKRPLEILRLQGMGARGNFFKVVTQKITGTGFIASLWAMNDLSPSSSGIDSCLRPTTDDCWSKCQRPRDYWLGLQPSSSILPALSAKGPLSSEQLSWPHLHTSEGAYTMQLHHLFSIPRNLCKTYRKLWYYPPFK